jgi:cell division protein FtsQ
MLEERRDLHYLRRPGNLAVRRHRIRRGLVRWLLVLAAELALIAGVVLAGRQVYLTVITSSRFEIRTIAVRGNHHARTSDLLVLAGPAIGSNIFRVDLDRLRSDVLRSSWVLDATIRKSLPSSLEVTITEREPAVIASYEGTAYLVDETGRRLAPYGPEFAAYDFPVLTGIEALPRSEAVRRIREGAAAVSSLRAHAPDLARRIAEIDLAAPDRLAVHLGDGSPTLYLDNAEPLRNLDRYAEIRDLIASKIALPASDDPAPKIAYVDLRFRGRIAVMPEPTRQEQERPQ